jgi:hypothetical protein
MCNVKGRGAVRRLSILGLVVGVFALVSCHKYTPPASTAITCTTTTSTTSTSTSSSSCTDPTTGITISIAPPTVSVTVATPTQFQWGVSGGTNNSVKWKVNGIAGGDDTVGRIDSLGKYIAPIKVPSPATVNVAAVSYEDQKLSVTSVVTIIPPPTVTISPTCTPTPCMLTSGSANTMTFTSTVTGATTNNNVFWLVNGVLAGNPTFGTITAAGVYTAPNTPPIGSTVTVTAASQDSTSSVANATVTISGYSTSSFQGQFAFSMAGRNASGAFFRAGSIIADGAGKLSGGLEDVNAASCAATSPISFVGTYTVSADGRGTMTFADGCTPSTFGFILVNNNQLQITGFDTTGTATGQANLQDPTFFNASGLIDTYVFDFAGVHGSSALSQIGEFTSDGLGKIIAGSIDVNDGGSVSQLQVASPTSTNPNPSPYFVNSNGRGTATISTTVGGPFRFTFYIVSRGSAVFVGTDPQTTVGGVAGVASQQSPNAPFDATSLNGNIAFSLAGPVPNGTLATAGSFSADGNLHITAGVLDENVNGTATQNMVFSNGSYAVASTGRGAATFTAGGHTYTLVFYLSTPGNAVLQETDSGRTSDGSFAQQQTTAFSLASIQGSYALQTTGLSPASPASAQTIAGPVVANGAGAISSGTIDINSAGTPASETVSGTYSLPASNGRVTLTLNPSTDNRNFAVYVVNSTQVFVIGIDAGRLASGAMYKRF